MIITTMLARPFAHTSAGAGVAGDGRVRATAGTWRDVTVASGTYRILLAPSTGTVTDFLSVVAAALTAALVPDGITVTAAVDTLGKVYLTATAAIDLELSGPISRLLGSGFTSVSNASSAAATYHPQHVAYTGSFVGPEKEPVRAGGWEVTAGGRVYGFAASAACWRWPVRVGWLPRTATEAAAAGCPVSPLYPVQADLGSLGVMTVAREWTWMDVLHDEGGSGGAVPCALAQGNFQDIRTSTSERYWLVQLDPESLSPKPIAQDPSWPVWHHLELVLWLPSASPSGTRA